MPFRLYVIDFPHGKKYFGITSRSLEERWRDHHKVARRKHSRRICVALRKYPKATIRTLVIGSRDYIHALEIAVIEKFNTRDRRFGYNRGFGGDFNPMLGNRHSQSALAKISQAGKTRTRTAESRAKTSASLKGHAVSFETRAKLSAALKGRPRPVRRNKGPVIEGFS